MRRRIRFLTPFAGLIVVASGFAGAQTAASNSAQANPAVIAKPVTVHLKMVTVNEALKALGKAGGVSLAARNSLQDLKVTVLVKDEPLQNVMARLGDLFHAAWTWDGVGYVIAVSPTWPSQMQAFIDRENEDLRKAAETQTKKLIAGAAVPYATVLATLRGDQSSLTAEQKDDLNAVTSPERYLVGSTLSQMGSSEMADFWHGRILRASAPLPPADQVGGPTPPAAFGPPGIRRRGQPLMGRVVRVIAFYDPLTGELSIGAAGRGRVPRNAPDKIVQHPYPTGALADTPFGKDVLAWNRIETDNPRLQTQVQAEMLPGTYFGGLLSMADVLEWLHSHTGVPIVADAFRTPVKMPRRGGSVAEWLGGFRDENSAFIRTEGGFVIVRHGGFWRLREFDTPEDVYADLESDPHPSLDQYAAFAARLTAAQMLPFRIKGAALMKADPSPLADGMAALRFYASLGPDARRVAAAGNPIQYGQLGSSSQNLFMDALDNPIEGSPVGPGVMENDPQGVERRLGFLMTPSAILHSASPQPGGPTGPVTGFRMLFGTSPNIGVQYMIPVDH